MDQKAGGVMAALSFLLTNWQAILALGLLVVILGALAWFLKNWKLAVAAVAIAALYFAGQALWTNGYKTHVAEEVEKQTKALREQINQMNVAAEMDAQRAIDDANKISELETKSNETPANSGACLDIDGARRVRDIK
jgi:ABC-type bacteriocin/lantibiotic exporter with double-glycine peptidase domain